MKPLLEAELKKTLVPEVTLPILRQLVRRKYAHDRSRKTMVKWGTILFLVFLFSVASIIVKGDAIIYGKQGFREFAQNPFLWGIICLQVVTYLRFFLARKSFAKAEEDYEALRKELINRSTDLWATDEQWEKCHHVFEFMQAEYDINLYYE